MTDELNEMVQYSAFLEAGLGREDVTGWAGLTQMLDDELSNSAHETRSETAPLDLDIYTMPSPPEILHKILREATVVPEAFDTSFDGPS